MEAFQYGLDTPLAPPEPTRRGRKRLLAVVAVVVLLAASGGIWAATASSDGPHGYRTATVTRQTVAETLQQTGTIEPVAQAAVAFPTSGTVKSVAVAVGDTVTVGQTLATLDTRALQANVLKAEATLAQAQLTLQRALNGETTTSAGGSAGGSATEAAGGGSQGGTGSVQAEAASTAQAATLSGPTGGSSSDGTSSGSNGPGKGNGTSAAGGGTSDGGSGSGDTAAGSGGTSTSQLHADQQAVLQAQQAVDTKLHAAQAAMNAASNACAGGSSSSPSGGGSPTTTSTTAPASPSTTVPAGGTASTSCQQALQAALGAQQELATAQQKLASAAATLTSDLTAAAGQGATDRTGKTGNTGRTGSGTVTPSSTGGARSTTLSGSSSATPTAEDLIADQAAVDGDQLQVQVAQQALAQATLTSPISGTIAQVTIATGQEVGAASSTATIVVVGVGNSYEVATTVTVDQLAHLTKGATATVTPDGTSTTLHATVVSIGVAPSTGSSTTTYPVVLGITGNPSGLRNGATTAVTIVLDRAVATLAVPTSAVQAIGGRKLVSVLKDGNATATVVTTGAVGATYTAITSGLKLGETVVLADLGEPLPTSANGTSTRSGSGRSFSGFGGGAFSRSGFGGGAPGGG